MVDVFAGREVRVLGSRQVFVFDQRLGRNRVPERPPPSRAEGAQQLPGDVIQEPRCRVRQRIARQITPESPGHIQHVPRARNADIRQPTLFLHLGGVVERADMRQHAFLHARHEHDRVLEPLSRVQGDQRDRIHPGLQLINVRHQRYVLEEGSEVAALWVGLLVLR